MYKVNVYTGEIVEVLDIDIATGKTKVRKPNNRIVWLSRKTMTEKMQDCTKEGYYL